MLRRKKKTKKGYNLESKLRASLRLLWLRSPFRYTHIKQARVSRGAYLCSRCQGTFSVKDVAVDHSPELGSFDLESIGPWIYQLFYGEQRVLCKACHYLVTHG